MPSTCFAAVRPPSPLSSAQKFHSPPNPTGQLPQSSVEKTDYEKNFEEVPTP
ncbi:MAG: hypothetical protein LQ341_005734, partial [Variospora aurantia]